MVHGHTESRTYQEYYGFDQNWFGILSFYLWVFSNGLNDGLGVFQ